jgi:hypothetical protein
MPVSPPELLIVDKAALVDNLWNSHEDAALASYS